MKKTMILFFVPIFLWSSCNDESKQLDFAESGTQTRSIVNKSKVELMNEFGASLAQVLNISVEARNFLKQEALKKFDYDNDVLFQIIKDTKLIDGTTLEEKLSKYMDPESLKAIYNEIPTLTIFIPTLPENTFSPDKWDTQSEVPKVACYYHGEKNIPVFDSKGDSISLSLSSIPAFPVLVIKENERVVANIKDDPRLRSGNVTFAFIDEIFDNMKIGSRSGSIDGDDSRGITIPTNNATIPPELQKVYDAYKEFGVDPKYWQRDYVYYDMKRSVDSGMINNGYVEHIVGLKLADVNGKPSISDEHEGSKYDPFFDDSRTTEETGGGRGYGSYNSIISELTSKAWTDGEYEFQFRFFGGLQASAQLNRYVRIKPTDLFEAIITKTENTNGATYKVTGQKGLWAPIKVPMFTWDLLYISPRVAISLFEVDDIQDARSAYSTTMKFATNFSTNPGKDGKKIKLGFQLGSSVEKSETISYELVTHGTSDNLGETVIFFGDPIIVSAENKFDAGDVPTLPRNASDAEKEAYNAKFQGWLPDYFADENSTAYLIKVSPLKIY